MALVNGDIVQIVARYFNLQVNNLNVFYYRMTLVEANSDLAGLATAFDTDVLVPVKAIQSANGAWNLLTLRNLTNGIDIHEMPLAVYGTVAGEGMPAFVSWGFRLLRTNASTRHGAKRIPGVCEGSVAGNDPIAGINAALATAAAAMKDPITWPGDDTNAVEAEPVIVGRYPEGHAQAGQLDLTTINPVANAQFVRVTSQVSRRYGRGT